MSDIHDVELGRLGGMRGGKARAKKLSKEQRVIIAKKRPGHAGGKNSKKKS
jgi:hypothetical protein